MLAGLFVAVIGVSTWVGLPQSAWVAFKQWRAERFVDDAYTAWQTGRIRDAELAFVSALQMAPAHRRALHLQGRMFLQQRRRAEGRAVYAQLLLHETGNARLETAQLYLEALLATTWFEELPAFCLMEYSKQPAVLRPQFGFIALESLRISGALRADFVRRSGDANLDRLIEVRLSLNAGDETVARDFLRSVHTLDLVGHLRVAAVRMALEAKDSARAWSLINATREPMSLAELNFYQLWLDAAGADYSRSYFARILPTILGPDVATVQSAQRIGHMLSLRNAALALALRDYYSSSPGPLLDTPLISALWLHWQLSQPRDRAVVNPWQNQLQRRLGGTPINLQWDPLTPSAYAAIINTLPLSREAVIGLLPLITPEQTTD